MHKGYWLQSVLQQWECAACCLSLPQPCDSNPIQFLIPAMGPAQGSADEGCGACPTLFAAAVPVGSGRG